MCQTPLPEKAAIVFDLDDTLYPERDFVQSGFAAVSLRLSELGYDVPPSTFGRLLAGGCPDPFGEILGGNDIAVNKADLIQTYRLHTPDIVLRPAVGRLLGELKTQGHPLGVLTDGRSSTQRNKLVALEAIDFFDEVVISEEIGSEKPNEVNYRHFEHAFPNRPLIYVGDNLHKDFVTPKRLGWTTVGVLDQGHNIHRQNIQDTPASHLPHCFVQKVA